MVSPPEGRNPANPEILAILIGLTQLGSITNVIPAKAGIQWLKSLTVFPIRSL